MKGRILNGIIMAVAGLFFIPGAVVTANGDQNSAKGQKPGEGAGYADVISVKVDNDPGGYSFSVGIESPDLGCNQYANWWEVISADGKLLFRRILGHSHADEQPFVRPGGPVKINPDTVVIVRAHMHPVGYGGKAFKGSIDGGFKQTKVASDFAVGLAQEPPKPNSCAW